ncbi:peptidyl-prolyl cis-trans isomerase [bacterium]|nr:peptidyl-prolyl cis-trans isomerase [bacterium]
MQRIISLVLISIFVWCNSSFCLEDKVVAIVNNEVVTKAELDMYVNLLKAQMSEEEWNDYGISEKKALESLIEDRLVVQEARNRKIEIPQRQIDSRISRLKSRFRSKYEFSKFLLQQGLSLLELEERIREQMLSDRLITLEVRNRVIISPAEVTEFYQENIGDFYLPERIRVESIFVRDQDLANEIHAKLETGADFIVLQEQYSKSSSLGLVNRGQLRKDLEEVIFNLEVGRFSKPVEISRGYYIFLPIEKLLPSERELVEVQDQIYNILLDKKFNEKLEGWIDQIKSKSYIVFKDE